MASSSKSKSAGGKILCKYFMSNCCFKGELCPFSHDWKDKPDMRCKYYMKGSCVNGKNCRYDHVKPQEEGLLNKPSSTPWRGLKVSSSGPVNLPSLSSSAQQSRTSANTQQTSPVHKMVTLKDDPSRNPKKWVQAPEFVPGKPFHGSTNSSEDTPTPTEERLGACGVVASYSDILAASDRKFLDVISAEEAANLLCPFAEMGHCPFEKCDYLHGDICDMCGRQCLNPFDIDQQKAHRKECVEMHEREMEMAFQVQESEGKQCAICMEYVVTKLNRSERRFGILADCEHCFCLSCIRKWRGSTHTKTIRACPLCRKVSYYIIPSEVWIDDEKQKQKLIQEYKDNLKKKHCKYFNMGEGTCPFGSSCFYRHEFPDGREAENVPRFYESAEGERKVVKTNMLWDYFNSREERSMDSALGSPLHPDDDDDQEWDNELPTPNDRRALFWLNYEPDIDELEFL